MKFILILLLTVTLLTPNYFSQNKDDQWSKFKYLIGKWEAEGSGKPGEGSGSFTFKTDLDYNILVRTSHSEYSSPKDNSTTSHSDLMIIYCSHNGTPDKAIYFDNEGHMINYSITFPNEKEIVFTSDKIPDVPRFRLTYSAINDLTTNVKFEMSEDGENYFTYVEGNSIKIQ